MSATSSRLRWALGIAIALHLLLGLWLFAGAHHRDLAQAARRIALAEQALLPTTVQVAVGSAPQVRKPTEAPAAPFSSPAADADAEVQRLQLAAAQAAAMAQPAAIVPPIEKLTPLAASTPQVPTELAGARLREPAKARADAPGVVNAMQPMAALTASTPASLGKAPANRLPRISARTPAATAPQNLARAANVPPVVPPPARKPTANKAAPAAAPTTTVASAKAAAVPSQPDKAPPARSREPRQPKGTASPAPLQAYSPPVPVANSSFFAEREETYQLPSGKLSMRLASLPPRAAVSVPTGKGLPVETEALAAPIPTPSLLPPPPPPPVSTAMAEPELPVRAASELPRLGAVAATPEKPPAPSLAASEASPQSSAQDAPVPKVTIFEAPDLPDTGRASQVPRAAAPASQRAAFFQEVTTQLKATNAQMLADSLYVSQKITVRMKFSIRRDGGLLRIAAAVKTPDWAVIEAAKVIRAAEPFPPMPPDLSGKSVELSFPVEIYAR